MGLFSKIKTILFEDDDEVGEMPVYTSEDVKEPVLEPVPEPVVQEEAIKTDDNSRFRNVKRDIGLDFEDDVLGEVPNASKPEMVREEVQPAPVPPVEPEPVKEEPKGFTLPSFDEDEFERLNSHILRNEQKQQQAREVRRDRIDIPINQARVANSNYSATRDTREEVESGTIVNGKRPFTPSPVISPVYGILDKNYTKDDIKDKKGGLKREKVVKPVVRKEEKIEIPIKKEEVKEEEKTTKINIDSVRKKAYGELENMEKTIELATREIEKPKEEVPVKVEEEKPVPVVAPAEETDTQEKIEKVVEEVIPEKEEKKEKIKPQILDDVEKTSTLQILDDIEKELNSIKPISKEEEEKENQAIKEKKLDDTLENDLFNLIDSMYEEGEEEDDD